MVVAPDFDFDYALTNFIGMDSRTITSTSPDRLYKPDEAEAVVLTCDSCGQGNTLCECPSVDQVLTIEQSNLSMVVAFECKHSSS